MMIEVKEALSIVNKSSIKLDSIFLHISDALGHNLSKDIESGIDMPPFSQSAMDGYAICGEAKTFEIIGEIKAGDTASYSVSEGKAYRVFTGAKIPKGTTAIAKQEIVNRNGANIELIETVKSGTSIREKGEEIKKGELALRAGTLINPAAIGLLGGLGVQKIEVVKPPVVTIVVTGDELTQLGEPLEQGKIYESNSYTLKSALKSAGLSSEVILVKDDFVSTRETIDLAIQKSDVVIMTGGISVGDYDFVGKALNDIGVSEMFYKVKQKPGKPIYYGEKDKVKIFALPGNPAAALSCFYVYVLTAIKLMMGHSNPNLETQEAEIGHDYIKRGDRAHLLKAQIINGKVSVHGGQSSAMLSSFVDANCLLFVESQVNDVKKGEKVTVFMLPK